MTDTLWRISCKCEFLPGSPFRRDDSAYMLWDAAAVAPSTDALFPQFSKELEEHSLKLVEHHFEVAEIRFRPNANAAREDALLDAMREASLRAFLESETRPLISWSCWTQTEIEEQSYTAANKAAVWALLIKSRIIDNRCSIAFDGSTHLYGQFWIPANDKAEAIELAREHIEKDFCQVEEVLRCENCEVMDDDCDPFQLPQPDSAERAALLQYGTLKCVAQYGSEYVEDWLAQSAKK